MKEFLKLKKSNCRNCYKCIRHCPVKSIRFSGNQAHIVSDECILCGQCFVICPQNAKQIAGETEKVKVLMMSGEPVIASIAPSFIANYAGVGISAMKAALLKLGFSDVEETAVGATIVKREYDKMLQKGDRDILISSCCHSVNLLIQRYYPKSLKYLADVVSPMQAHALDIKRRTPEAKVVFIGPCVAKKDEADHYKGIVDAVLTFEELTNWLKEENIPLEKKLDTDENTKARFFPTTGGILKTMEKSASNYAYIAVDGVENCMSTLADIEEGRLHNCFIEMSACAGSCVGGPVMDKRHSPVTDYLAVAQYAGKEDFEVPPLPEAQTAKHMEFIERFQNIPDDVTIKEILRQMGKTTAEDILNCGSCGYNTCREKAIAVYQGKANLHMCLPYLTDKAENFSDTIINNTPNAIVVLNEKLEVQQINRSALDIMNLKRSADVMGEPVVRILDPSVFTEVQRTGKSVQNKRVYLAEYDKYVEQSVIFEKKDRILICIMRDVTAEEAMHEQKERMNRQTVEVADKVVEKQMRIVQEIAFLLGETAAETKIALTKLKESVTDE